MAVPTGRATNPSEAEAAPGSTEPGADGTPLYLRHWAPAELRRKHLRGLDSAACAGQDGRR